MATENKRAALYVRVSTDHQSVENQIRELRQISERRGWQVTEVYRDAGIHQWRQGTRSAAGPQCPAQGCQPPQVRYRHGVGY